MNATHKQPETSGAGQDGTMTAFSIPRCEPTFHQAQGAAVAAVLPSGSAAATLPDPPSAPTVRPGGIALPWLGLAAAALVLAGPVLGTTAAPPAVAQPASASLEPRLADEDEVAFGRFSLRLGGASSADELWRRWSEMKQRRLGLLDDLSANVRPAGPAGAGYLLLVGDFRNAATAAQACGTLRARFLTCEVVRRDGSLLQPQA